MNYVEQLKNYIPYNDMERKEKENMLSYINMFDNILDRENTLCHFTSSAFIVNKERTKILVVFHNIYQSWDWVGGHADGESNLLDVIKREIAEETGIENAMPMKNEIYSIDIIPVQAHERKGQKITAHNHLSITYLFEADENEDLHVNPDENSGVKWMTFDEFLGEYHQPYIRDTYEKIVEKVRNEFKK